MGEKASIPRLGMSGEIDSTQEEEQQKYFRVESTGGVIGGSGVIPEVMAEALEDETFKIAGYDNDDHPTFVKIQAEEIAKELGGYDSQFTPAHWWQGYADALKDHAGQGAPGKGLITLPISAGEIVPDPQAAQVK